MNRRKKKHGEEWVDTDESDATSVDEYTDEEVKLDKNKIIIHFIKIVKDYCLIIYSKKIKKTLKTIKSIK